MQAGPEGRSPEFSENDSVADTTDDFDARVRHLAYELWQQEGEPQGRDDEFWLRAEARLRAEATGAATPDAANEPDAAHADAAGADAAHDEAAAQSFPASDPPAASAAVSSLRSTRDLPPKDVAGDGVKVDEPSQRAAGKERRKAGGYS
jgi:hypothetical protein